MPEASSNADSSTFSSQTVDRRFQEKVWSWLTRHPEVSVGQNKQGNRLTLREVEHMSKDIDSAEGTSKSSKKGDFRVFVSQERTWFAIAGHGPDETKIFPTEFALLSIIASRKGQGIVQPELVAVSGQDKRSVPKRTDMLALKGYIEKRPVQTKKLRTSLCILQKFAQKQTMDNSNVAVAPPGQDGESKGIQRDVMDVMAFVDEFFGILREHKIVHRADLRRLLRGDDLVRRRLLNRSVRGFENVGVVKRVRAKSQYSSLTNKLHHCVMLVREPSQRDLEKNGASLASNPMEDEENANGDYEDDDDEEEDLGAQNTTTKEPIDSVGADWREAFEESGRTLPIWTPDRNIYNMVVETIDSAGMAGMTAEVCRLFQFSMHDD